MTTEKLNAVNTSRRVRIKFNYSDGVKIEENILNIIKKASDISYNYIELAKKITNWPEYYHLGLGRANILHCLDLPKNSSVLEIGSGCGAITRFLGEHFGVVHGIEGSLKRAEIARERCRDLNNVTVFNNNLNEITTEQKYDIIIIVGVLEYSPLYIDYSGEKVNACFNCLNMCKKYLSTDGIIITAIENKLGLKYWNGAKEDHGQGRYAGIIDYPRSPSPITFSKKELLELFIESGFKGNQLYYALPDYKFATTLFNDLTEVEHQYNWIREGYPDPNNKYFKEFSEQLAYKSLSKAGLFKEFLNSFVLVSSLKIKNAIPMPSWSIISYSLSRNKNLQTITELNNKVVKKTRYWDPLSQTIDTEHYSHHVKSSPFILGEVFTYRIIMVLNHKDKRYLEKYVKLYLDSLIKKFRTNDLEKNIPLLDGAAFDYTFGNLIIDAQETLHYFDDEWHFKRSFPADYILYRSVIRSLKPVITTIDKSRNFNAFRIAFIKQFFPNYNNQRDRQFKKLEAQIMKMLNKDRLGLFLPSLISRIFSRVIRLIKIKVSHLK